MADVVVGRMKDQSVFQHVKLGDIAKYQEYGIETVDQRDMLDAATIAVLPEPGREGPDPKTVDEVFLLVMETGEMEEAVGGGITFLRDTMTSVRTNREQRTDWVRCMHIARDDKTTRVVYAVLAVGDTDAMPERAMYRSKQNTAADCNQAGELADKVMEQLGGVRLCPRGEIDVARDEVERDVAAFIDTRLLPALVP